MKILATAKYLGGGLGVSTLLLVGCATTPENELLSDARDEVQRAQDMESVNQHASETLELAQDSLERAETLWEEEGRDEQEQVEHQAYLAKRRAETAVQYAALAEAEQEVDRISNMREQVIRQGREHELEAVRERAQRAEREAQIARREAREAEQRYRSAQDRLQGQQDQPRSLQQDININSGEEAEEGQASAASQDQQDPAQSEQQELAQSEQQQAGQQGQPPLQPEQVEERTAQREQSQPQQQAQQEQQASEQGQQDQAQQGQAQQDASQQNQQLAQQAEQARQERAEQQAEIERLREQQQQAAAQPSGQDDEQLQALREQVESIQAEQTDRGMVLTLDQVLFATGEAELQPGGARAVEQLASFLEQNPDRNLLVEGFTDNTGDPNFNETLSRQRAEAVREQLVSAGIDPERIEVEGHGESYPIASNETAAGRQLNRRVEVVIANNGGDEPEPRDQSESADDAQN